MLFTQKKQFIETAQSKPEFMTRDEFIEPKIKKMLKIVKDERPIEILMYYNDKGEIEYALEQFWLPTSNDILSDKWI